MNRTKIIAKVDENNNQADVLKELILNGVDAFCINMYEFSYDFCLDVINKIRILNKELDVNSAIMLETVGSKVHVNRFLGGSATFKTNDKIRIYMNKTVGDETKFSVDYKDLVNDVKYDSIIKLSNGLVKFQVLDKGENFLLCKVVQGGTVYDNTTLVVPGVKLKTQYLSKEDQEHIKFAANNEVDYIVVSYVNGVEEVLDVNDLLIDLENNHLGIIAKIENQFALDEIDDIINICEGIVIARENLGMEIPLERIPGIQKSLINKCHIAGKLSIIVSDMVSNLDNSLTKAEVSDIANAVLDGTDALMFNSSKKSLELLKATEKVIKAAEQDINYINFLDLTVRSESKDVTGNVACSVAEMASRLKCKTIVVPTISGYTARKMSRFRPRCPIIAISTDELTVRSLALYFGVCPVLIDNLKSIDDIMVKAKKIVYDKLDVISGDKIIITGGYPFKDVKHTNLIVIEEL
ncbi:MAG: pyruvate kinase [Firmicutes bacterium]|nr:pyruvate kinase [Bacillota bacterium]